MALISFTVDESVKEQAKDIFDDLGITMSEALNMFLTQAVREKRIPFEVSARELNQATLEAILEGREMLKESRASRFKSVDDMFADLGLE